MIKYNPVTICDLDSFIDESDIKYAIIGNGGCTILNKSIILATHQSTHTELFNQIPFILRPLTDTLQKEQIINYRFKKQITIKDVGYIGYYAKPLIKDNEKNQLTFTLSLSEISEIINACKLLHGDDGYTYISEIGLCVEKPYMKIIRFISTFLACEFSHEDINLYFDPRNYNEIPSRNSNN